MQALLEPSQHHADTQQITQLLRLHGVSTTSRSYVTRAANALPSINKPFTVPVLARKAGIPRSKGYPTIKELQTLRLVKPVPKTERPPDWDEYTRSQRRRFNRIHGLSLRGVEPQRYKYTPEEALKHLRETISREIITVDQRALREITELSHRYKAIEDALSSHQQ